jgi:hypothetical protein
MKVHNVEWVADGAAQFIQKQARGSVRLRVRLGLRLRLRLRVN